MIFDERIAAVRRDLEQPLYRNAYALMLGTALTSALGLAYWVLAARLYEVSAIGAGAGLVTAMALISALTQLDFVQVLVRFLPRAGTSTRQLLLAAYGIAAGLAIAVTTAALVVVHLVTADDNALRLDVSTSVWFVVATASWSIFCLQDGVLTGMRKTLWIPLENGLFGVAKLVALGICLAVGGSAGIFLSWTIPVALAVAIVNHFVFRKLLFAHVRVTALHQQPLDRRTITKFIAGDYAGNISVQLSTLLVPVLVIAVLDETANGYFYVAQVTATAVDLIAINLATSLTVEGANDETRIRELTVATLRRTLIVVAPLALVLVATAPLILTVMGSAYAAESTTVLRLLLLAGVLKAVTAVHGSLCRILHRTSRSGVVQFFQTALLVVFSLLLMPSKGINGVGLAALLAQSVTIAYVVWSLFELLRQLPGSDGKSGRSEGTGDRTGNSSLEVAPSGMAP